MRSFKRLPTLAAGLILFCAGMQAAHADDCAKTPGFPTHAEVTRATGLAVDESVDLGGGCVYASKQVGKNVTNNIQLMRAPEEPKATFDKMLATLRDPGPCTALPGVGDVAYLCEIMGSVQGIAYRGDTLFVAMISSQVGMDPTKPLSLPAQTAAILKVLAAK